MNYIIGVCRLSDPVKVGNRWEAEGVWITDDTEEYNRWPVTISRRLKREVLDAFAAPPNTYIQPLPCGGYQTVREDASMRSVNRYRLIEDPVGQIRRFHERHNLPDEQLQAALARFRRNAWLPAEPEGYP